jgi:hypothetical protein
MSGLTREQVRAIIEAAVDQQVRRFGEMLQAGAFDDLDWTTEEGRAETARRMGVQPATPEDVRRWTREGWLEASLDD